MPAPPPGFQRETKAPPPPTGYIKDRKEHAAPSFQDRMKAEGRALRDSVVDLYRGATGLANMPFDALAGVYNTATRAFYPKGYDVTINGERVHRAGLIPTA